MLKKQDPGAFCTRVHLFVPIAGELSEPPTFGPTSFRASEFSRNYLPHLIALACEKTDDSERRDLLFAIQMVLSVAAVPIAQSGESAGGSGVLISQEQQSHGISG